MSAAPTQHWLGGEVVSDLPIGDYGFLSDCHSAALISRAGSVDWLCLPRFDSASVFGRLLDDDAGHWSITAAGAIHIRRTYLPASLVLRTEFTTATGVLVLTDALALGPVNRGHEIGAAARHLLLRSAECVAGEIDVDVDYAPRSEYGIGRPLPVRDGTTTNTRGGSDPLVLTGTHPLDVHGGSASARVRLRAGQSLVGALSWDRSWQPPVDPCGAPSIVSGSGVQPGRKSPGRPLLTASMSTPRAHSGVTPRVEHDPGGAGPAARRARLRVPLRGRQ